MDAETQALVNYLLIGVVGILFGGVAAGSGILVYLSAVADKVLAGGAITLNPLERLITRLVPIGLRRFINKLAKIADKVTDEKYEDGTPTDPPTPAPFTKDVYGGPRLPPSTGLG